ncbi:MAG: peptidase [Anaerocolumna sp.]|nr:peptidase [Anaerocolumna sp.]
MIYDIPVKTRVFGKEIMNRVEILAPAGSMDSLKAALNAGCDAVYVGGTRFGARAYADNFTTDTMKEAIDLVHLYGKNIYLTVNTLLKNKELEKELFDYIKIYYEHGIDAVIIQDLGVLHFLHENFPDLPLHASTQMSLTMGEGAKVLKEAGVTRVVNARELNLSEIRSIKDSTGLEVESFVHGALCYCYSGKCLLSSMIGGRSGNRGRCAQPCRMPYQLKIDGQDRGSGYYLSPKDIETLELLPKMIQAGIDSFKIEGRMKGPEYTAIVTSIYRKYRDLYYDLGAWSYESYQKSHTAELAGDIRNLSDIYNRGGFSKGYYEMHGGISMLTTNRPNHSGLPVGKLIKVTDSQMVIELQEDINAQDILEVRNKNEALYEFTVKNGENKGGKITSNYKRGIKLQNGYPVYRTRNNRLLGKIRGEYLEKQTKLPVRGVFTAHEDSPMRLTLTCFDKEIQVYGDIPQEAQSQPVTEDKLLKQLDKLGDTNFYLEDLKVELRGNLFIPVGKLNELRRYGVEELRRTIQESYRRPEVNGHGYTAFTGKQKEEPLYVAVLVQTEEQLRAALKAQEVTEIMIESDITPLPNLLNLTKEIVQKGKKAIIALPFVLRSKTYELLLQNKSILEDNTINGFLIRNLEEYELVKYKLETEKRIIGDYCLYAMNRSAGEYYAALGVEDITAPYELNYQELKEISVIYHYITVYSKLPVMISAQCLYLTEAGRDKLKDNISSEACSLRDARKAVLTDRLGNGFPVARHCRDCYNVIYNSKPLSLLSCEEEVKNLKPSAVRLDFTEETEKEASDLLEQYIDAYLKGIHRTEKGSDYTRGHFKRGID